VSIAFPERNAIFSVAATRRMRNMILCSYLVKLCQCIFYIILEDNVQRRRRMLVRLALYICGMQLVLLSMLGVVFLLLSLSLSLCVRVQTRLASSAPRLEAIFISLRLSSVKVSSTPSSSLL